MTKLMKQLQRWATEGALIFPCEEYQNGAVKTKNGILHTYMIHEHLQHVLDGTIKVWRPVEHYPPPTSGEVLALFRYGVVDEYEVVEVGDLKNEDRFTHWQPLTQLEKGN